MEAPLPASDPQPTGRWVLFASTFTTVFLAELGDKTQLATLLLSAQSGRRLLVFICAALDLVSTSLVVLGGRLSRQRRGSWGGCQGLMLISKRPLVAAPHPVRRLSDANPLLQRDLALVGSTLAVFLAELGDKTQLATVAISGTSNAGGGVCSQCLGLVWPA